MVLIDYIWFKYLLFISNTSHYKTVCVFFYCNIPLKYILYAGSRYSYCVTLETQTVWALARAQSKEASHVFEKNFLVLVCGQRGANGLVHSGLVSFLLLWWDITFLLDGKNITFTTVLFLLFAFKIGVIDVGWNLYFAHIDTSGCGDDITLRNAAQWALVQRVRSSNQQQTRFQNLHMSHMKI